MFPQRAHCRRRSTENSSSNTVRPRSKSSYTTGLTRLSSVIWGTHLWITTRSLLVMPPILTHSTLLAFHVSQLFSYYFRCVDNNWNYEISKDVVKPGVISILNFLIVPLMNLSDHSIHTTWPFEFSIYFYQYHSLDNESAKVSFGMAYIPGTARLLFRIWYNCNHFLHILWLSCVGNAYNIRYCITFNSCTTGNR